MKILESAVMMVCGREEKVLFVEDEGEYAIARFPVGKVLPCISFEQASDIFSTTVERMINEVLPEMPVNILN